MTTPNFRKFSCFLLNAVDVTFNRRCLTGQRMKTYIVTLIHWISRVEHQKVVSKFHKVHVFKVTIYLQCDHLNRATRNKVNQSER